MSALHFPDLLAEFLVKSAVILALGCGVLLLLRSFSPAAKHHISLRIFAGCLAIPLILVATPRWQVLPDWPGDSAVAIAAPEVMSPVPKAGTEELVFTAQQSAVAIANPAINWTRLLSGVWIAGASLLLLQLLISRVHLQRIEKSARSADTQHRRILDDIIASHTTKRSVRLLISSQVKTPFTWGILHPAIVLPREIDEWPSDDLEMVLLHEVFHIQRNDAVAVLISRIFLAFNWVNPFAWLAIRQSVQFREQDCDLRVLRRGHSAPAYAEMLFRQAQFASTYPNAVCTTAVAENGTIEQRIKMILHPNTHNRRQPIHPKFVGTVMAAAIFAIAVAGNSAPKAADVEADTKEKPADKVEDSPLNKKLQTMVIPSIEFNDTPLFAAIEFLQHRSVELDPDKKGVNIIVAPDVDSDAVLTLKLSNVPFSEALRYTAALAGGALRIDENVVLIIAAEQDKATAGKGQNASATKAIEKKLETITLPKIQFSDTPFTSALEFLVQKSSQLDKAEKDPTQKGVNIVLKAGTGNAADPAAAKVTLKLSNVNLATALHYTCELAGYEYSVEPHSIVISPASKKAD